MKLKSYYMDNPEATLTTTSQATAQPTLSNSTQSKPKKKYLTKVKGYQEDQDFLYYNNFTDERELAEVTNFKYTQDSSDDTSY